MAIFGSSEEQTLESNGEVNNNSNRHGRETLSKSDVHLASVVDSKVDRSRLLCA